MIFTLLILVCIELLLLQYGIIDYLKNKENSSFIWGHTQNLGPGWGEGKKKTEGPLWKHGRGFLYVGQMVFHAEWGFFSRSSTSVTYTFGADEKDLQFHVSIYGLFSIWISGYHLPFFHWAFREIKSGYGYDTGITFSAGTISIEFCRNETWGGHPVFKWTPHGIHVWAGSTYKNYNNWHGLYVSIHYVDMILGSNTFQREQIGEPVEMYPVIYPDTVVLGKSYKVTIQMERERRTRPRWFSGKWNTYGNVNCDPYIPSPGKGESDYDLDDNDLGGGGFKGSTPEEVLQSVVESVLRERDKYGMPNSIMRELVKER